MSKRPGYSPGSASIMCYVTLDGSQLPGLHYLVSKTKALDKISGSQEVKLPGKLLKISLATQNFIWTQEIEGNVYFRTTSQVTAIPPFFR